MRSRWEDYGELEENDFSFIPKYKKQLKTMELSSIRLLKSLYKKEYRFLQFVAILSKVNTNKTHSRIGCE